MTPHTLRQQASSGTTPPATLTPALKALWLDAAGDWHAAHEACQEEGSPACAHVHAYLHRKEGDLANASYWYHRAGQAPAHGPLDQEWENLTTAALRQQPGDAL